MAVGAGIQFQGVRMMEKGELSIFIKSEAERLGFDICGIAKAQAVTDGVACAYNCWIEQQKHGTMQYLERNVSTLQSLSRGARVLLLSQ